MTRPCASTQASTLHTVDTVVLFFQPLIHEPCDHNTTDCGQSKKERHNCKIAIAIGGGGGPSQFHSINPKCILVNKICSFNLTIIYIQSKVAESTSA